MCIYVSGKVDPFVDAVLINQMKLHILKMYQIELSYTVTTVKKNNVQEIWKCYIDMIKKTESFHFFFIKKSDDTKKNNQMTK